MNLVIQGEEVETPDLRELHRIARGKESQETRFITPWPMRMIQLQVCMLYFDAFLWKIRGETWMNGLAI